MKPKLLHIGWARSGSTALRLNFLSRHSGLLTVGRDRSPTAHPIAQALACIKETGSELFEKTCDTFQASISTIFAGDYDRIVCISDEELSIGRPGKPVGPREIGARCGRVFADARVLAVVRDQTEAIRSLYGLAQFLRPSPEPFGEWVERCFLQPNADTVGFSDLFAYMKTLKGYLHWCERADLLVVPYHEFARDAYGVYRSVAEWLGISPDICASFPNDRVNASDGGPVNRFPLDNYLPGQERRVRELFAEDNATLERQFGITFDSRTRAR